MSENRDDYTDIEGGKELYRGELPLKSWICAS